MPARSELALAALALAGAAGCDAVLGLDDQPRACELASFDGKQATRVGTAETFSVDWDQTFAVVQTGGLAYELSLRDGTAVPIDLGIYSHMGFALTPEGNAIFYTDVVEPFTLTGALRDRSSWHLEATVPHGAMAGTPSADAFGPRRVLIKERMTDETVREYQDTDGVWTAIGPALAVQTFQPPSLTPNGLTMVFASFDEVGNPGVYAAQRPAMDQPFGERVLILAGAFRSPQLCGKCRQLYVIDESNLVERLPEDQDTLLVRLDQ